jgi:hypothetical protein
MGGTLAGDARVYRRGSQTPGKGIRYLARVSASGPGGLSTLSAHPGPSRSPTASVQRTLSGRVRHSWLDCVITVCVVLFVASPMLLTHSGFALDFTNHLWLVWYQERFIEAHLHPTFFLNAPPAPAFSPQFAFYGATLYTLTAIVGALLGTAPVVAFVGVSVAAIAASYGGSLWLVRQLGVRGLKGHAPAMVFVTSAYYVTNIYGRGAWPEFMATSMLPLLSAAGLRLVRGNWGLGPLACFVVAMVFFSGSHNITLLWGSIFIVSTCVFLWLFAGRRRSLPWRRLAAVSGLGLVAAGLNSWFLIPDVVYAHDTAISSASYTQPPTFSFFNSPHVLFSPLRTVPAGSNSPGLFVQAPVWFLAWSLAAVVITWPDLRERSLRGPFLAVFAVLAGFLSLIIAPIPWDRLPSVLSAIQFGYRLNTYVAFACAGLVLIGVLAMDGRAGAKGAGRARALGAALTIAAVVSLALCAWQLWVPSVVQAPGVNYPNRNEVFESGANAPRTWYTGAAFADASLPLVAVQPGRTLIVPAQSVKDDSFNASIPVPAGSAPFATDIGTGPYFIHIDGLRIVGRTSEGLVLARRADDTGPVHVVIRTTAGAAVVLGRILTLLAALVLLAVSLRTARRHRRRTLRHA